MKESEFIEQNKEKWLDFESNLLKKDADPSKTSELFVQITDDLSYARTFYQNRSVKLYLNGIAKLLFDDLNKADKKGLAAFINFWKIDLPLIIYASRRAILISFLVFLCCFVLGILTSMQDKNFARTILSNDYVNMTNDNIAKGDAMAVYKSKSELKTFLPILYNNLRVDFLTFFSGIFMAIGSIVIMVVNGVMVGVFQYFFIERGLFWQSFLAIWTHGTLEISAIILSGGAGLTLGKGLLFPDTYSRLHAFKISAMNGLKIIIAVAPITLIAAFIEGFLTRHTDIPDPIRFVFILISLVFVLTYFFFYPRNVAKKNKNEDVNNTLVYKPVVKFNPSEIYPTVKIITGTFRIFLKNFIFFSRFLFVGSLLCSIIIVNNPVNMFRAHDNYSFNGLDFFNYSEYPFLGIFNAIVVTFFTIILLTFLKKKLTLYTLDNLPQSNYTLKSGVSIFLSFSLCAFIIYTNVDFTFVTAQILFPILIFLICVSNYQNLSFYDSINYSISLIGQSWYKFTATAIIFISLSFIAYTTSIYCLRILFIQDAIVWVLTDDETVAENISLFLVVFQTFLSYFLYLTLSFISNSLLFFTLKESFTAEHLISKIKAIKIN